jgi:hypothetical protein
MFPGILGYFPSSFFSSLQVEEFNDKQKEVEAVCNPIITKMYQSAGGDPGNQRRLSQSAFPIQRWKS